MVEEQVGGFVRPRARAWGGEPQREVLRAIAEDVRAHSGFGVCAIEVARADGMLEFVAIAGCRPGEEKLLGQASPLAVMHPVFAHGVDFGALTFVAAETMSPESQEMLSEVGFIPDIPPSDDPDAWRAEDMLAARIVDDLGQLRGILYLDEPESGKRLGPDGLHALSDRLGLQIRAVLTMLEREELANRARVSEAAAEALRGLSLRTGVEGFITSAHPHVLEGLRADEVEIRLLEGPPTRGATAWRPEESLAPGFRTALDSAARRAWEGDGVVIVEPEAIWGDEQLSAGAGEQLQAYVASCRAVALVCVPMGTADEPVGYLLVLRRGDRWTEVESLAAHALGKDLGRAIQLARSFEREQKLVAELQRVDARRTEFARTVSHELKNPLTVVVAHLELLEDSDLTARQQGSITAIGRAVSRLQRLLRDLSMISRGAPEAGGWESVDLGALVRDIGEQHRAVALHNGVDLEVNTGGGDHTVHGSADELASVVNNLVDNAVKYSDRGGRVRIDVAEAGGHVVLTCTDEGIGISAGDQLRLFADFFRSTNPDALQRPGTGLGLAIVRRIVETHGGRVDVESVLGKGTTFTVHLPAE